MREKNKGKRLEAERMKRDKRDLIFGRLDKKKDRKIHQSVKENCIGNKERRFILR